MKDPYVIIVRPVITEKTMGLGAEGKYTFQVDKDSNKIEIADAISKIFKVKVAKVNTLTIKANIKRQGRGPAGRTPDWKKAYVTLEAGQKIEMFEGA
jgi:large subunit ribosomal protein L23